MSPSNTTGHDVLPSPRSTFWRGDVEGGTCPPVPRGIYALCTRLADKVTRFMFSAVDLW